MFVHVFGDLDGKVGLPGNRLDGRVFSPRKHIAQQLDEIFPAVVDEEKLPACRPVPRLALERRQDVGAAVKSCEIIYGWSASVSSSGAIKACAGGRRSPAASAFLWIP
jgi:hypothetical protein